MNDLSSINGQLVELVRDLAERAEKIGFTVRCVGFDVPGDINGVYETMRVDLHLHSRQNV